MKARSRLVSDAEQLFRIAETYRSARRKISLTTGAFDILHPGHLLYLEQVRSYGDVLIVGVTSDRTIRADKGAERPVNPESDRAFVVAGFWCVDHAFIFDGDDVRLIDIVRPAVCVYSETSKKPVSDRVAEIARVERHGGKIVFLPAMYSRHTSDIIRTLRT